MCVARVTHKADRCTDVHFLEPERSCRAAVVVDDVRSAVDQVKRHHGIDEIAAIVRRKAIKLVHRIVTTPSPASRNVST